MSNGNNGKLQTAADLENVATKMEKNLQSVNKVFIKKMLNTLNSIMAIAQRKEKGIFTVILKWFRLYLKLYIVINPDDKKLLKYYENSALTIITYIIGCLQYKTKEVPNYHYNLLDILEELLNNIHPSVMKNISKFQKGTIGCLWHCIDLAGDFNTQLKALRVLSVLLKQFDEVRRNEELKCIKWTNLNLFQDKLKTIVQETKLSHVVENSSRELLNSYNMNLSKNIMVYSFFCKSVILGNKYKFYKPLNLQKFWIDINYCPKTLSYCGRFKLNPNSKYENINVILKIQNIILENNILRIYFNKPADFSKYSNYLSNIADNIIQFTLTNEEKQRLIDNDFVIKYFKSSTNAVKDTKSYRGDIFDLLKNEMRKNLQEVVVESSKPSRNEKNDIEKHPIRNLRDKNKFFTSLVMEQSDGELVNKNTQRKRKQNPKSRKPKSRYKQVCKVTPSIDLTKIENMNSMSQNEIHTEGNISKIPLNQDIPNECFPLITTQSCDEVLKQVADVYEAGDTTYAKPCQSYRNFRTQLNPIQKTSNIKNSTKTKGRKKKNNLENESSVEKKRKLTNCYSQENKENINPKAHNIDAKHRPLSVTKSIIFPHLFETQCRDEASPSNKISETIVNVGATLAENIYYEIESPICCKQKQNRDDINNESISSSSSLECEEIRGLNENYLKVIDHICTPINNILTYSSDVTTPIAASSMNISNFNNSDSDMEITQVSNSQNRQVEQQISISDTNTIRLENDNSDVELIKSKNAHSIIEQHSDNDSRTTDKLQTYCKLLNENIKVPVYLQQILKDFECSSDDELDLSCKTPTINCDITPKHVIHNDLPERSYHRESIIFQNRKDMEESSSSDEDINCDGSTKQNFFPIVQNMPLILNPSLCQETGMRTTPGKTKNKSSTNTISTMATTCQVTPTTIIMHQLQVSAKKSVILRNKYDKTKKVFKIKKSLNDYFTNKKSVEFQRNYNLKNVGEGNLTLLPRKDATIHPYPLNTQSTKLLQVHNADGESLKQQQLNSTYASSTEKSENNSFDCSGPYQSASLENSESLIKKDLLHIINDYTTNMKLRVENALCLGLKNISDKYTRKFLEISKAVLKKSDENRMELEQIREHIGRLVRELEEQYDMFITKSKQFDIHREMTEQVLDSITTADVTNIIRKDYEDIFQQINIEESEVFQKVWRRYLEKNNI